VGQSHTQLDSHNQMIKLLCLPMQTHLNEWI